MHISIDEYIKYQKFLIFQKFQGIQSQKYSKWYLFIILTFGGVLGNVKLKSPKQACGSDSHH